MSEATLLRDWETFIRNTQANSEDCLKALDKLKDGLSVDKVIRKYNQKVQQAQEGIVLAKKEIGKMFPDQQDYVEILTMDDCIDDMMRDLTVGKEKGSSTYIDQLDNAWTWKPGEFNIWTGYSNEGKSIFLRYLCLIKAIMDGWKFAFYAPEDFPAKEFFDDIIHTASGYSTDRDNPNFIRKELYTEMYQRLKDAIYFVYMKPTKSYLKNILTSFIPLTEQKGIRGCIIDPLIKVARPKEFMMADDKYAGYVTTMCTDFSRKTNISLHLVMHQITPKLQENGLHPKPSMYNIKGGGTWADGTDNVMSIWRPTYARDKVDDEVVFSSLKIKKQKLVGFPQDINFRFDRRTNRYVNHINKEDLFDFDDRLRVPRMKMLFAA